MEKSINELRLEYYKAIEYIQDRDTLIMALPSPEYENFFDIIDGLIELLEKKVIEYEEMLKSESKDSEMYEYIREELSSFMFKLEVCNSLREKANDDVKIEDSALKIPEKRIIFATTNMGNVYVERDLKDIPEEYYPVIKESIESIEKGYIDENKNDIKTLSNNKKLSKLSEIKPFKVRIIYRNIDSDTIYVLLVRMKKGDNDLLDRKEAIVRNKKCQSEYEKLKELMKDEDKKLEIIEENDKIKTRIFGFLDEKGRGR